MANNTNRSQGFYNPTGNPDTMNSPTLYNPGQLGQVYEAQTNTYQCVQLDSGATAATPTGAVAANQLAFWKDRSAYLVTNDPRFSDLGPTNYFNSIAGVFRTAVTAGNYCNVLQKGRAISVVSDGSGSKGDYAVAKQSSSTAGVTNAAAGTAPPTQKVGVIAAPASGGVISVNVDIASID
jgi:hypothetical protein